MDLVFLPDSGKVMRDVTELCYKECPWMPDDPDELFVHEKVPWSTCERLDVKTQRDEALQQHDIGLPFGQNEKLTNRLKRILTGYQGEKEILKELLQNADDAQATEICFIKDPRYHPDKRVFKNSWKPLQGPALCVYNNKPFTTADIKGICNLGEGSKGEDPNKTGQYGVGFNAVYQLTDAPSFISKGDEIGDVLCVFDPHCKYISRSRKKQESSEERPGRMFKDIDKLKKRFPDVFPCYLEEHFPVQNATMFRFPLRSEEMARESHICQTSVTVEKLDEMMEDLKKELFDVLLFLNNVKKITLAAVDESGKMIKNYCVEVMSQDDDRKREEFSCYLTKIGKQVKEKKILPVNVKLRKRSYSLQLQDNNGNSEKWLVVQQVGFEKPVPKRVIDASQGHRLGMLPRGAVACLLDSTLQIQRVKRAYCFLPLPLRTNLPVHINGHFALDHETRRNLWRNEAGGYQSDWTSALLCDTIASCYLTLLDEVREFLQLPVSKDSTCSALTCSKTTIFRRISSYERLFPSYPIHDSLWKTLADAVYQEMNKKKMHLIPLVRSVNTGRCDRSKDSQRPESVELTWLPPTGTGRELTFFNNLEIKGYFAPLPPRRDEEAEDRNRREQSRIKQKAAFEETLLETGFNLVAFSLKVFHSLKEAGVEVYCVSPSAVIDFYKSFTDVDPLCRIGAVPCHVSRTPFKHTEGVVRVLKYCKDDELFLESLTGLPLLLTQDNFLHPFSERQPRCLSRYGDILPRSEALFVQSRVRNEVFITVDPRSVAVFRPLDVETFASQLHLTMPPVYRSEDCYVKWYPDKKAAFPSLRWISRVWDFLQEFALAAIEETHVKQGNIPAFIRDLFSPLSKWSLIPSTEKSSLSDEPLVVTHVLVPFDKAEAVLDFKECGTDQTMVDILRNLGLPELNKDALTSHSIGSSVWYSRWDSYDLARNLVATVSSPHSLLFALNQKLLLDPSSLDNKLKLRDAIAVLDYFSRNIKSLTDADRGMLKKLPFYQSANGVLRNLEGKSTFVIPCEVPAKEMCIVEAKLCCLLLRSGQNLSDLYEFLELKSTSLVEVYTNFVLKCFKHLSLEGRMTHLQFIRDHISSIGGNENECETAETGRLFEYLKVVKLIPSTDGKWKTVSSFYDPHNDVFVAMLPPESFPPDAFNSEEWITFLRKIGLVQNVSHHDFLTFTKQVEREAEKRRTDDTYKKSQVLVYHLISRPNVVGEGLLPLVRDIAFVAADPVDERLQAVCPPFGGANEGQIPFIAFSGAVVSDPEKIAWTQAHLLPRWADPRYQKYNLFCPPQRNFKLYLNNLLAQLKVLEIPSVDLVVKHCKTICYQFGGNKSERDHVSSENLSTIMDAMQSIYSFLQENAMTDSKAQRELQKTPCILVDQGRKLILPKQAILELYENLEIKPFLYRVPPEFGMFHSLFEFLGCSKTATPIHYAMVLEMLERNSQGETLHPNEVRTCSRAMEGFIDSLQEKSADVSTLSTMYLPAVTSRDRVQNSTINTIPVSLQESKKLLFDDSPEYGNRIQELNQPFVLDLSLMNFRCKSAEVNYEDLLMKLPKPLQPTMLSLVVKETLTYPQNTVFVTTGVVNALKQQLSSVHFGLGIARIIKDACSREGKGKDVTADIEKGLETIELVAVESINTSLLHNDVLIPGSARDVSYFKEKLQVGDEHRWRVYVNATTTEDDKILLATLAAKVIVDIYGEHLGRNAYVIPQMLVYPPTMIQSLLDKYGIRKDDSFNAVEMTINPEPGTLIPIEDHHLLDDAFEEFEPEEYVGCQLHDPSLDLMEGTATYIYAIIIEQVTDKYASLLTKVYRINVGHGKEPVKVKATKLFKFWRLKAIFDEQSGCHRSKQEVFDAISNMLREAWVANVSEEDRLQIIKRLCLRWHPKKNAGNEEFYGSVYEHIKSEVSRLGGSYDEFFASWGKTAREHGSQREEYIKKFCRLYGSWTSSSSQGLWRDVPPSFCTRNPQPEEAKRWLRQAKADLQAGLNEFYFSTSSFEWVCFKFHQAAEKALKAARYNKDADKLNVHNLVVNCHDLGDPELVRLARALENLVGDSTRMRYPDRMSCPKIPNDVYSHDMAQRASEIAEKIVERVKTRYV